MYIARSCLYPSNKPHARYLRFLSDPHWQIEKYVIFYPKHYDHAVPRGAEGDTARLAGTGRGAWSEEIVVRRVGAGRRHAQAVCRDRRDMDRRLAHRGHGNDRRRCRRPLPCSRGHATVGLPDRRPQFRRFVLPPRRQSKVLRRDGSGAWTRRHPVPARRQNEPRQTRTRP